MNYKYLKTPKQFWHFLIESGVNLDINKTARSSRFTFYTIDGQQYFHSKLPDMLTTVNKLLRKPYIDVTKSVIKGKLAYMIYLQDDSAIVEEDIISTEVSSEEGVVVEEAGVVGEAESKGFDLSHAEALEEGVSKKDAKAALVAYAEQCGLVVENKNQKFEDMLVSLKEQQS